MRRLFPFRVISALVALVLTAMLLYQIPAVESRLSWRIDIARTYLRGILHPAGQVPTPRATIVSAHINPTSTPEITPTSIQPSTITPQPPPTPTHQFSPTPLSPYESLPAPTWEKQDWNNCGPAALAMYLRFYGWEGDQFTISDVLKPVREDRNVNVEELAYYTRTQAGWLQAQYRVGGDIDLLKQFIAAGIPVMIEASFYFNDPYWPNDDLWAAHYLLLTGYDDATQTFTAQDTFHQPNQQINYQTLDEDWKIFNRVYILIYLPDQEDTVKSILGSSWDVDANRQHALEVAQAEIDANPDDALAWFNLGTNLVYFERYNEAAGAYDTARTLGLPQRMLRYQFGPFFAYFHSGRIDELLTLTEYALERTYNSEEALLWHGWALYRQGDINGAIADFYAALEAHPNYQDAQYAIDFVSSQ